MWLTTLFDPLGEFLTHLKLESAFSVNHTNDTNYYVYPWHKTKGSAPDVTDVVDECSDLGLLEEFQTYSPSQRTAMPKLITKPRMKRSNSSNSGKRIKDFRLKRELASRESIERLKFENIVYSHSDEKPWICKNCGRNYKWKNSLKCHLRNECGVPPKYHCTKQCGYKTHIYSNLKRHLKSKFCRPIGAIDNGDIIVTPND